jgi:hypothetical protein
MSKIPTYITVKRACEIIGGEANPIHVATYYRNAQRGIYPKPEHPSPGISRVNQDKLIAQLRANTTEGAD